MNRRVLIATTIIAIILLLATAAFAVFLFVQNRDLSDKLGKTENCQSCPTCEVCAECPDCPKCPDCNDGSVAPVTYPVKVYFSKNPESFDDPSRVYAVDRTAPTLAVATFVIKQLITGPTTLETAMGYFSDVKIRNDSSICDDNDFRVSISNSVATLQFCRTFDAIGVMSDARAQEIIKASLLQFPTIKKVVILSKTGHCLFDASGLDLCLQ